jgi:uracil-DNA glycosylase family 4
MKKKEELLSQVNRVISTCQKCRLWRTATNAVAGEGSPEAKVMFIGEAPGFHEDKSGRPFVGRAGGLLDNLLAKNGLEREDVFITNVVKHRPPDNRAPMKDEARACLPYLHQQIKVIKPEVIVPLGRAALEVFIKDKTITEFHGKAFKVGSRVIFPVYHPAAALRSASVLRELERDFAMLKKVIAGDVTPEEVEVENENENQLKLI